MLKVSGPSAPEYLTPRLLFYHHFFFFLRERIKPKIFPFFIAKIRTQIFFKF